MKNIIQEPKRNENKEGEQEGDSHIWSHLKL